jgi:hypothetical protein
MKSWSVVVAAAFLLAMPSMTAPVAAKGVRSNQAAFNQPDDVKNAPASVRQACHQFWDTINNRGTAEFVQCVRGKMKH